MKTRIFVLFVFAVLMVVLGTGMTAVEQRWAGKDTFVRTYEAELYRPVRREMSSIAAIQSASSGTTVLITNQGLDPSQVTIQAGHVVTWVNQTSTIQNLVNGQPYQVYLPLMLHTAKNSDSTAVARVTGQSLTGASSWASEIAPGGTYTRTFTEDGDYLYFIAAHPDWTGQVIVQSSPAPTATPTSTIRDLDEIVRAIPLLGSQREEYWEPDCIATPPIGYCLAYYESQALLDHGFGGDWTSTYQYSYPPSHRYLIGYQAFSQDHEPQTSPHSFAHHLDDISHNKYSVVSYTGAFTSTLYDPFTYSVTISFSPYLESATVIKDYGSGEVYDIELDIDRVSYEPIVINYLATVYGEGYSGATRTVDNINGMFLLSLSQ